MTATKDLLHAAEPLAEVFQEAQARADDIVRAEVKHGRAGGGSLAEMLAEPTKSEEIRFVGLTREEQRVFVKVEHFRHAYRGEHELKAMSAKHACKVLEESYEVYSSAREKAVATNGEAFSITETSLIRSDEAIATGRKREPMKRKGGKCS